MKYSAESGFSWFRIVIGKDIILIKLSDISKTYVSKAGEQTVLDGIDLEIKSGDCVGCFGASGCGKTTLLNIIGLLDRPSSGKLIIDGQECGKLSDIDSARIRGEKIGFVFQSFHLEPRYTVWQNIEMPLLLTSMGYHERRKKIHEILERVGMVSMEEKKVDLLSGGEKQRTAIARALIRNPGIILADEPCGNLDIENKKVIMEILSSLATDGKTVLIVTHDPSAAEYCNRIISIKNGKIVNEK